MKTKLPRTLLSAVLALFLISACGNDLNTAQGIAEEFVDHHYVKIDLQKAKQYTVSVAQAKIDEEIRLTKGQAIDASTQKPRVNYTLLEKKEGDQRSSFLFEGKIQSDDGTSFIRKWSVATRKEANGWRVSNFTESD